MRSPFPTGCNSSLVINVIYPVIIFRLAGAPTESIKNLLGIGMVVPAVTTFIQIRRLGPVGSGYVCPSTFTATFLGPSTLAVAAGGLPLVFGMTPFAGPFEAAVAPLLNRLRPMFPSEIPVVDRDLPPVRDQLLRPAVRHLPDPAGTHRQSGLAAVARMSEATCGGRHQLRTPLRPSRHALLGGYFRSAAKSANNAPTTQMMTMIAMLISSAPKCGILIDYVGMLTLS